MQNGQKQESKNFGQWHDIKTWLSAITKRRDAAKPEAEQQHNPHPSNTPTSPAATLISQTSSLWLYL